MQGGPDAKAFRNSISTPEGTSQVPRRVADGVFGRWSGTPSFIAWGWMLPLTDRNGGSMESKWMWIHADVVAGRGYEAIVKCGVWPD